MTGWDAPTELVRVAIVERHRAVADGLAALLSAEPGVEVVAVVDDVDGLLRAAVGGPPDVVVLSDGSGTEGAIRVRRQWTGTAVLWLSEQERGGDGQEESDEALLAAVEAGVSGYLLKARPPSELVAAVRAAARAEMLIPADRLAALLVRRRERSEGARLVQDRDRLLAGLTPRERDVLRLVAAGLDNKSIARELSVGTGTARSHVQHVLEKLGVHSKLEAAALAVDRGLLDAEP